MSDVMDRALSLVNDAEAEIERLGMEKERLDGEMRTLRAFVRAVAGPAPAKLKRPKQPPKSKSGTRIAPERVAQIGEAILAYAPMGDFTVRQLREQPGMDAHSEGSVYKAIERLNDVGFLRFTGEHVSGGRKTRHYAVANRKVLDALLGQVNGD